MTEPKLDMRITLGNVITIIAAIMAFFFGYVRLEKQSEQNAQDIRILKEVNKSFVTRDVFEIQTKKLDKIDNKLDRLIERLLK